MVGCGSVSLRNSWVWRVLYKYNICTLWHTCVILLYNIHRVKEKYDWREGGGESVRVRGYTYDKYMINDIQEILFHFLIVLWLRLSRLRKRNISRSMPFPPHELVTVKKAKHLFVYTIRFIFPPCSSMIPCTRSKIRNIHASLMETSSHGSIFYPLFRCSQHRLRSPSEKSPSM